MILLLAACGGPDEETLVDELRVLAVVAEPPEVAPGAAVTLTATVADPTDEGADVMIWTCTDLGDGCLEAADSDLGVTAGTPTDGTFVATRTAPAALAGVVSDGETVLPLPLWSLACTPGTCPPLDLAQRTDRTTEETDTLAAFLAEPTDGLADLPLVGTSLGFSFLFVSMRATPATNPVITPPTDPVVVEKAGSTVLTFGVTSSDTATAWAYTTAGGFEEPSVAVTDGEAALTWFAPEKAGSATLWVVVVGEDGGTAVWTGTATVE